ncbi:MAG: helix-turn-helix domain-containing protein, partial [Bacteroidales bacterium]|nr:helix-turn-helix domain-containing protein [Bacteroidales bacterium]
LLETIKLRMYEMGLSQKGIADLLGISELNMSDIILGKKEPSLSLARTISKKLNIEPSIVLGV